MSDYKVFARKYRPLIFDEILGQDHVVRTLKNAIKKNRLAHAYLFVGPRGTGKTTTARILAKALNCNGGPKYDFDPNEKVCQEIAEGINMDVMEIDGASNNSVDQIRDLRDNVKYMPNSGQFRIYYIDEVHMLSTAAFNALLKTLEEPPEHVKFIFATTEQQKILPTILSRCQRFDLRPIPVSIISEQLLNISKQENFVLTKEAAIMIAKGADGGMRDAQSMLDQLVSFSEGEINAESVSDVFGYISSKEIMKIATCILENKSSEATESLDLLYNQGKSLTVMLNDIISHFHTLLIYKSNKDNQKIKDDISDEHLEAINKQIEKLSSEKIIDVIDIFIEATSKIKWVMDKQLYLEIVIVKAIQCVKESSISDVVKVLADALNYATQNPGGFAEYDRANTLNSLKKNDLNNSAVSRPEPKRELDPEAYIKEKKINQTTTNMQNPTHTIRDKEMDEKAKRIIQKTKELFDATIISET